MATTRGDELIRQQTYPVAACSDKAALERERDERAKFRADYLAANPLPPYALAALIADEAIVDVPTVAIP